MLASPVVVTVLCDGALVSSSVFFDEDKARECFFTHVLNRLLGGLEDDAAHDAARGVLESGDDFVDGGYVVCRRSSENALKPMDVLVGDDVAAIADHVADSIGAGDDDGAQYSLEDLHGHFLRQLLQSAINDIKSV